MNIKKETNYQIELTSKEYNDLILSLKCALHYGWSEQTSEYKDAEELLGKMEDYK